MPAVDVLFRALSDPSRRALFERLTLGEVGVTDLAAPLGISQPAVSQHLAVLREAGLVAQRREGRRVYYRADARGLGPLVDWMTHYQAFWTDRLAGLRALLEKDDE